MFGVRIKNKDADRERHIGKQRNKYCNMALFAGNNGIRYRRSDSYPLDAYIFLCVPKKMKYT